ncbi:MAG: potassium-transporting ATPase subunit F [Micrococcales bacterium]|nr:potassium-transporting ATPase subunit F [Micrococcales bacterium]
MTALDVVGLIIAAALLVYLGVALVRADKTQ